MTRREALRRPTRNREKLRGYSVRPISVLGSTARDQATAQSDVDLPPLVPMLEVIPPRS